MASLEISREGADGSNRHTSTPSALGAWTAKRTPLAHSVAPKGAPAGTSAISAGASAAGALRNKALPFLRNSEITFTYCLLRQHEASRNPRAACQVQKCVPGLESTGKLTC